MRDRLHLIGSIPLDSSEQVFRRLSDELGPFLRCMPDGETGERSRWVYFQRQMLLDHPAMEIDPTVPPYKFVQWDGKVVREIEQVRFKPGVDPATVTFETGYDKAALASWETFKRLRDCRRDPHAHALPGLACRRRRPAATSMSAGRRARPTSVSTSGR